MYVITYDRFLSKGVHVNDKTHSKKRVKSIIDVTTDLNQLTHDLTVKSSALDLRWTNQL